MSAHRFRSGLERQVSRQLELSGVPYDYEEHVIRFTKPSRDARYTPDFIMKTASGKELIIETKGRFVTEDRQKHLLIRNQFPERDIRFVFSNSATRISKTSKTTYAAWCEAHDFKYADKLIPKAWLLE